MTEEQKLEISRLMLVYLSVGNYLTVEARGTPHDEIIKFAMGFAANKGRKVIGKSMPDDTVRLIELEHQKIKRRPGRPKMDPSQHKYPIGALDVGESVLIELPPVDHGKVRSSAKYRAAVNGWTLSCNKEGDWIRVTRHA